MEKRLEVCKTAIPSELGCGVGEPVRLSYRKHDVSAHGVSCLFFESYLNNKAEHEAEKNGGRRSVFFVAQC